MTDEQRQRPRERSNSDAVSSVMWARRKCHASRAIAVALVVLVLGACSTEYHGPYSDIDGVLWRQVASFEDPFTSSVYQSWEDDPNALVESLPGTSWDGTSESAGRMNVADGGVVIYDVSSARHQADFSVFISSGLRAGQFMGAHETYTGPSAVFTCYKMHVYSNADATLAIDRIILDRCPSALVEAMPDDAAFASGDVFDG
jgi:hypothetical protein